MQTRIITGLIFGIVMIAGIVYSEWSFVALFFIIGSMMLWEFGSLVLAKDGRKPLIVLKKILIVAIGIAPYAVAHGIVPIMRANGSVPMSNMIFIGVLTILLFPQLLLLIELFGKSSKPFQNVAFSVLGLFYIGLPILLLPFICKLGFVFKYQFVLGILILIWANDVFAYFSGRAFGKHKLFPRISPNKTWEGSLGGAIGTVLIAISLFYIFPYTRFELLSLQAWVGLGIICAIFGGLGDLVESMLKRSLNIKDSGNILPGHGGILDRFDAFVFVIPFAATYLYAVTF